MEPVGKYKMGTLCQLSGFNAARLRAWEQRHGILVPVRAESGHRLYTDDDLAVVQSVRKLIAEGRSIGELANLGRDWLIKHDRDPPRSAPRRRLSYDVRKREPVRASGDEVEACRARLVEAAERIDEGLAREALDQAFSLFAPDTALRDVIQAALHEIGRRWAAGQLSVASEHLVSSLVIERLRSLTKIAATAPNGSSYSICACLPDELHEIGILQLAYYLGRSGIPLCYLGPSLPFADLEVACQTLRPPAVFLSVTRPPLFQIQRDRLLETRQRMHNETLVFIGGAGVPSDDRELEDAGIRILTAVDASSLNEIRERILTHGH